jgi:type III pantothenate kinase
MDLLVDLGNTRLKWAVRASDALRFGRAVALAQPDWPVALGEAWVALPVPRAVAVAAVAGIEHADAVLRLARTRWPTVDIIEISTPTQACGVRNGYVEPARLGVDRFMAMIGARARHAGACVVAGAGTALAVDVLDAEGQHRGGAILPSVAQIERLVLQSTARVRVEHAGTVPATDWGRSTEDGLATGAWLAQAALIDRIAEDAHAQLGVMPRVLLHGGAAGDLIPRLRRTAELAPSLVFEGMALRLAELLAVRGTGHG